MSTAVELKPVKSSMFSHVGYSDDSWVLSVVFKSTGLRLDYQNISPEIADEVLNAESIGKTFNELVKGKFQAIGDEQKPPEERNEETPKPELTDIDRDIQLVSPGWDGEKIMPAPSVPEEAFAIAKAAQDVAEVLSGADPKFIHFSEFGKWPKEAFADPQDTLSRPMDIPSESALAKQPKPEILAAWTAPKTPIEALTMLQDRQGEIDAMVRANTSEGQAALQLRVTDAISHQEAGVELASLVKTKDRTFGLLDPIRAILYRTYEMAGDQQKKALGPLDVAIQHVKRAMGAWEQAQEQLRMQRVRLEREKAEAAARELQQQQSAQLTLAEVGDALEQGDTAKAEELLVNPISVPLPYVAPAHVEPTYLPPAGQSTRANWKVDEETVNLAEFLTAIKAGKYPIEKAVKLLKPDLPALNKMAKALESAFDVPGFVAVNEPIRSVRRQKML